MLTGYRLFGLAVQTSVFGVALSCVLGGQVFADSLTDSLGPREVALGDSMRAMSIGSLATSLNPAGVSLDNRLVFDTSYGYRRQDGASIAGISACDSTGPIGGCYYYHYLGASQDLGAMSSKRRFHEAGVSLSYPISPKLVLGKNTRYFDYNSDFAGQTDASGFAIDAGAIFRASQAISVALVGYNLYASDSPQYPLGVGSGVTFRPNVNLAVNFDALWNLDADDAAGRFGGGVEYFVIAGQGAAGYPLRVGGVYDAGSEDGHVSFGLGYANPKFGLDLGVRRQVSGDGEALLVTAGLRLVAPTPGRAR